MRALMFLGVLVIAAPDRPDRSPKVDDPIATVLGDWRADTPDSSTNSNSTWRFTPSEAIWLDNGKPSPINGFTATYSIDWTKNPVTIDLMLRRGGKLLGILKLEGDKLTIGLHGKNGSRPTDFGSGASLQHFSRIKD